MIIRGLIALSFGALSFGVAEFVVMGLLPYIAKDFGVSTSQAGHTISAYAIGVVLGAFFMVIFRRLKLKHLMVGIIIVHLLGIVLTALCNSYEMLLLSRVVSGLPHGCFFGVATIIAQRMAQIGKGTTALAIVIAGQTVSNVFGVPLGTALAHSTSWRTIFYMLIVWSAIVLISIIFFVPDTGKLKDTGFKGQFVFLKNKAPWLILGCIFFSSTGFFAVLSYISPILTDYIGLELEFVSAVLIATGISMTVYNIVAGRMGDKFTPGKCAAFVIASSFVAFVGIGIADGMVILGIICICYVSGTVFGMGTLEQVSIVNVSVGGELLGVALAQVAFNGGNAIGAIAGGIPFDLNLPIYTVPAVGALFILIAFFMARHYAKYCEAPFLSVAKAKKEDEYKAFKLQKAIKDAAYASIDKALASGDETVVIDLNAIRQKVHQELG